jgi:hypothetical protein
MVRPARPNPSSSGNRTKIKLRLDCLLVTVVTLIVLAQFSLHSSVDKTSGARPSSSSATQKLSISRIGQGGNIKKADDGTNKKISSITNSNNQAQDKSTNKDDATTTFPTHYTTFSTACSASQNWQSFIFFFFAAKVQQPGYVIRIASGCSEQQRAELLEFQRTHISKLSDKFSVHFTPDYAKQSGDDYKYYNKPFGIQHWLEHGLNYKENEKENEDAIIMILDPDMILLRPLTYDFTDSNVMIHKSKRGEPTVKKVMHGQPWASLYAFGDGPFRSVDADYVFQNLTDSNALRVSQDEKSHNYPGGPPYMATGRDMYAIVNAWCMLVPR